MTDPAHLLPALPDSFDGFRLEIDPARERADVILDRAPLLRPPSRPSAALALWMIGSSLVPLPATAGEAAATAALIAEARRAFTLNGKQIPPEIFRVNQHRTGTPPPILYKRLI
jgi:hypothetical protein